MNYFATPVSSLKSFENYSKTVIKGISLSFIANIEPPILKYKSINGKIYLWGFKGDKRTRWASADEGDILFFYHNKKIISYSQVVGKFESPKLAESLWGSFENIYYPKFTWPLIFVLNSSIECHVPFITINKIVGYNENYFLRSFFKLSNKFAKYIEENYKNLENFITKESLS